MSSPSGSNWAGAWPTWLPRYALVVPIVVTLLLAFFGRTRLYYDYGWQLMSVRDFAEGTTPNPFVMRHADPDDLTRDTLEWTIGYPLAYNAAGAALCGIGLGAPQAHRTIAAGAIILGIVGWHLVFTACTGMSPLVRTGAFLAVTLSFNGAHMVSFMMPETFLFATVPWQLWSLHRGTTADTPAGRRVAYFAILGAATGLAYTFRYLAALCGLPLLACAALRLVWRRPEKWVLSALALAMAAAIPVGMLSALNYANTGAINSTSSAMPFGTQRHWPSPNQWLLVASGSTQALFGSAMVFDRMASKLAHLFVKGAVEFETARFYQHLLALSLTLPIAALFARFSRSDRKLWFGLASLSGTAAGLLWLFSSSTIPQTDPRYFIAPALLLWPTFATVLVAAWRAAWGWRIVALVSVTPAVFALLFALYAEEKSLVAHPRQPHLDPFPADRFDPVAMRAMVQRRLPPDAGEIVWMCFQPGVLFSLGGRHVFESYSGAPVDFRASRPVTLVVLRDQSPGMHPSVYAANYHHLDIEGRAPDFTSGDYDVFIRRISASGLLTRSRGN